MKDPAFLLYTSDFLIGCAFLGMEERGQYITLLCLQHQKGHLALSDMEKVVGHLGSSVLDNFKQDENGLYFNERAEQEINKRQHFIESRRSNRVKKTSESYDEHMNNICETLVPHMENENININNNLKNKDKGVQREKKKEASLATDIIDYFNEKVGTAFRASSKTTQAHINARSSEGYTIDDFKAVIDKKTDEWKNDPKMRQYLRPETLFGTKFESYLNQKETKPKNGGWSYQGGQDDYDDIIASAITKAIGGGK